MIKSELIQQITENNPHLYHRDVERIINTVFNQIITALRNGDRVELRGFGVFAVKSRKSRLGRNPRTGSAVKVEAKRVPVFRAGRRCAKEEARRDLAATNAAIRLFSVEPGAEHVASYMDVYRLFKRGEQVAIRKAPCWL